MTMSHLSLAAARALHLAAQGLLAPPRRKAAAADVLAAIRQMGALQIDTISVVARSPYLVLWSRLGNYQPDWLEALLADGALFEYWAHEACFLPIEDYGLYRHRMLDPGAMGWKYSASWMAQHAEAALLLEARIRADGPVRSSDFKRTDGQSGGWWGWKPEKRTLEALFTAGRLMIARRHNFQRIYDLRERVLPAWDDTQLQSPAAVQTTLALKAVHALGIARREWIADYFRTARIRPAPDVDALADAGALLRVQVEGWDAPAFVHPERRALLDAALAGQLKPTATTLLSPFDPVVWDRKRALTLFGFDYRLECYTPAPKRRYGYFTLPILSRGALVGRLDAKAHRSAGVFEIKDLYLEPGVRPSQRLASDLALALRRCALWHGTPEVRIGRCDPAGFGLLLSSTVST
ncbi:winged helix-turn-helix domain-containing protein [Actimicrobium sp. GrIS 1.19]|uniref:winged helix-turn-helix domain-containing protein n=1 Tax=Actimicrobium sp. GrIS 1.19 TaxID=3071708 RepID=UPI002E165300